MRHTLSAMTSQRYLLHLHQQQQQQQEGWQWGLVAGTTRHGYERLTSPTTRTCSDHSLYITSQRHSYRTFRNYAFFTFENKEKQLKRKKKVLHEVQRIKHG